jgi:hypothetical protein
MAIFFGPTESEFHDKQSPPRPELSSEFPGTGHGIYQHTDAQCIRIFNDAEK